MPDHAEDRHSHLGLDQLEEAQGGGQPTLTAASQDKTFSFRNHVMLSAADPDPLVRGTDPDPSVIKQK
jgi:hypothetical protein